MKIEMRRLTELVPYAANAKQHDARQVANLAESIRRYGFVQPVVVDSDDVIVIGHGRVLGAKEAGLEEVPCVCVDNLTPEQVRELRLLDNKLNESAWDLDLLADELPGLDLSGFDLEWSLPDELDNSVVEDGYDPGCPVAPRSKLGDVYQLGKHRLMCGDSTSLKDVQTLVGGAQMDLLLTDPPYNVNYQASAGNMKSDCMKSSDFRSFLLSAFSAAVAVMKPGAAFYVWHSEIEGYNFRGACMDAGLVLHQCLVWVKSQLVLGRLDFQSRHEPCLYGEVGVDEDEAQPCLYGWTDGKKHYFFKNRRQTSVLNFDKPRKSAEHPTMKPVKLFDYQMQCSSKPGENVLDLFAGSGTTVIAAEQNGRRAYCMELDPKYVDVIIDRWEKFTGKRAVCLTEEEDCGGASKGA